MDQEGIDSIQSYREISKAIHFMFILFTFSLPFSFTRVCVCVCVCVCSLTLLVASNPTAGSTLQMRVRSGGRPSGDEYAGF